MKKSSPILEIKSRRLAGLLYGDATLNKPMLVLFNQWRSGAHSILSKYIAKLVLEKGNYSCVLFIDRIASGGASDNKLSKTEKIQMNERGEFQFGKLYAENLEKICKEYKLPQRWVIGGSSAGAPAVLAIALAMNSRQRKNVVNLVMVEPGGLRAHGFGKNHRASVPHAFIRQLIAYRHRVRRGWWTPMDKEQYFAKGTMFEHRAHWFARNFVFHELGRALSDSKFPPICLILSKTSHIHNHDIRSALQKVVVNPHRIIEITGNHDKICQPPSLSVFYSDASSGKKTVSSDPTSK